MTLPEITERLIQRHATDKSFERGRRYRDRGAVLNLEARDDRLIATVAGSQYEPYQVEIAFDRAGITQAFCSCPYERSGWCKHIIAVLLTVLEEPESVDERPSLETLIADLDRESLQRLVLQIAEDDAGLINRIDSYVERLRAEEAASQAEAQKRRPPVDPESFRRRVYYILHSLDRMRPSEAYWHVSSMVNEVGEVLEEAWEFIRAGDGQNALRILEAITDEYVNSWYFLDDSDGYAGDFFMDLSKAWAEAVLTAELTEDERREWKRKLERWQAEAGDYGIDAFYVAIEALEQGWDYEPLQRVLQGDRGAWEGEEAPWYADELADARLNVLERQERYDAYLNLAQAKGQITRYVTMLVQLDRAQEAVEFGLRQLCTMDQALALAQALRGHDHVEEALRIAEHGLTLQGQGHKARLASWLRDVAAGAGRENLALDAAITAFRASPNLDAYQQVKELAGSQWPQLREKLLDFLREQPPTGFSAGIDIFLQEELIDDAIAALGQRGFYKTVARVAEAAIESRPDWVISASKRQAEQIMDAGKSKAYHHAVEWLARAKAAYKAAGREEDWRSYLNHLLDKHSRKYKLVPMLKDLR